MFHFLIEASRDTDSLEKDTNLLNDDAIAVIVAER